MLKTKKNSRQVPKSRIICADKKYFDILYSYIQCISFESEGKRFFYKKDINFSKLSQIFGITRQTISTKFKNLKELELIKEVDDQIYEVVTLNKDVASLIPYSTLKILTDALNENSISVFVYLLNRYYANGCQPLQFTLDQIKQQIGISTKTRSNNEIVTNILFVLGKLGLVKYSLLTIPRENDSFSNVKTVYRLDWLSNAIKENC